MQKKNVLITDIDNTLFDWFDMWHASFSGLIDGIMQVVDIDREELLRQCKKIHQEHGTSEYLFLLEELPVTKGLSSEQIATLQEKYYALREKGLVLYDGVEETLKHLKDSGVRVIAFSESKKFYSAYRLSKLGLDCLVDHLYCPEDHDMPSDLEKGMMFDDRLIRVLPKEFKKPDPEILHEIARNENTTIEQCLYVGDSKTKDIEMAHRAGVDYLWFSAGAEHLKDRAQDYDLLKKVTHWDEAAVSKENKVLTGVTSVANVTANNTIAQFAQIKQYF